MKRPLTYLLVVLAASTAAAPLSAAQGSLPSKEAHEVLDFHNKIRDEVGVGKLTWSNEVARFAQDWANQLARTGTLAHRPEQGKQAQKYGENLALLSATSSPALKAAELWYAQKSSFTPGQPFSASMAATAGNYTQMVWGKTTKIGVGKAQIISGPSKGQWVVVCNYDTRGNVLGESVY